MAAAGKPSLGKIASDHIDAVERGFGGDRLGLARPGEAGLGDGEVEMLGHVATIDDGADLEGDLVLAAERIALSLGHRADLDERLLGRLEEFGALARALGRELRVAADDEALAGIVVRDDLRHVALVEQRELQGPPSAASALIAGARSAVIQSKPAGARSASMRALVIMPRSPTSTMRFSRKRDAQLADLIGERARIAEIAFEHLDGDRAALRRAQETEDDLRPVAAMIAAVAELRQFAAPPLQIARGDVVEHEHAVLEVALGEDLLDAGLAAAQKVEGGVELVLVDLGPEAEHGAERVGGGRLAELARGRELGGRLDDPRHDHGEDQLGPALRPLRQHLVEPEPAHRPEHGGDMAVRQRAGDLEALGGERHEGLPGQHPAQALDLRLRPVGDVGERARLDLAALAIALAQQDGGRRNRGWDARDVHDQLKSWPHS